MLFVQSKQNAPCKKEGKLKGWMLCIELACLTQFSYSTVKVN